MTERAEAERFVRMVEVLREADNEVKSDPLAALEATSCTVKAVCELKRVCTRGYRRHVDAVAELQRARTGLDRLHPPDLEAIKRRLSAAQPDIEACTNAEGALRRRYDL